MRSGPNDNVDFSVQYVLDLIGLLKRSPNNFWAGKGVVLPEKGIEEPAGIITLKSILKRYEEEYKDFYHNEAALRNFFKTCRDGVGKEMIKLDKKNPNACELYQALMDNDKEKIHDLHRARVKIREFDSIKSHLCHYDQHATIKKHENGLAKIEAVRDKGRPYLLFMQDYLANLCRRDRVGTECKGVYAALSKYINDVLLSEESEFLKVIPTAIDLALCIRTDTYCPRVYNKDHWKNGIYEIIKQMIFQEEQEQCIRQMTHQIMKKAFTQYFNHYFKDLKDVIDFIKNLEMEMRRYIYYGPSMEPYEGMSIERALANEIIKHPNILNSIAATDLPTREMLYEKLPGLKAAIKKQVYTNTAVGLLLAKNHGALGLMDKNIIKRIAGHAADQIDEEPKKLKK